MNSKSITHYIYKNRFFVGSILLGLVFLINFTNQNLLNAQPVDEKGYDLKGIGGGAYVVTSNGYNNMFLVTGEGAIVVDSPPAIGEKIFSAISEVTNETVKYLI